MFYAGFFLGVIAGGGLLGFGYYLSLWNYQSKPGSEIVPRPRFFANKGGKRTPKYVSDEEQARRESRTPISDIDQIKERNYSGKE